MTKKELWDTFIRTGKVSDYLKYANAKDTQDEGQDIELAEEIYPDGEEYSYDDQNGWFGNS